MSTGLNGASAPQEISGSTLLERVRAAADLLESIGADRSLLGHVPSDERNRLLQAAGRVSRPDAVERRQLLKFTKRARKAAKVQRAESVLAETGIRKLRRQPVFTSPNVFPPTGFEEHDSPAVRDAVDHTLAQNCYICKQDFTELHHFYDQLCPSCAALNFAKRTESADLRGRVALLTGGRVKIGYRRD